MTRPSTAQPKGLRYYDASHRYKLDGEWVPGVTTILGVLDKPGLRKWAASSVAEYVADNPAGVESLRDMGRGPMVNALKEVPWQKRDDTALRGTTFHDFAERIAKGEEVDVPEIMVPLVENALRFMEDYDVQPILTEAVVGSREHRYAGKLDLIAESSLGRCIFDWKSGKRVYPTFALQLVAYALAEFEGEAGEERPLPEVEGSYGVHIRADGYDVIPLKFGPDVYDDFLAVRRAFDVNKRVEGNWKVPGSGFAGVALTPPTQEKTA